MHTFLQQNALRHHDIMPEQLCSPKDISTSSSFPKTNILQILELFAQYDYICDAVRGAEHFGSAEIIPYEPDMYNDSAGKRYGIHCLLA